MLHLRRALTLAAALTSSACFQMTTTVHVRSDAAGTIDQRLVFSPAAMARMKQFALLGGSNGQPVDLTSEAQARADAASLGPGTTLVSTTPMATGAGQGRASVYAFTDIDKVRINPQPSPPGGVNVRADGMDTHGRAITFTLVKQPGGNALLTVLVPLPELPGGGLTQRGASAPPEQIAMLKQMFAGAHVSVAVEVAGAIVHTSSPFVDGSRVTLLDVNLDQLLKDDTFLPRIQAAKSADEMKTILQEAPGLKISFDRAITIEFTPAK